MAYSVFAILLLLIICSKADTNQGNAQTTTPPPLTFDCSGGEITSISGSNISMDTVLVDIGHDGTLCHYSDKNCNWQNKQILRVIYEPDEDDINSKFVAGKLYRYILECKTGYLAQASVAAFEINSLVTKPYYHLNVTEKPPANSITVQIFKKGETSVLTKDVFVGDELELKITGPEFHSLKPVECAAYNKNRIDNKYTLWDNTACKSHDDAIMASIWNTVDAQTVKIDMFAFRFVDSFSITIECSAYVCPSDDLMCGKAINNCLPTVGPLVVKTSTPNTGQQPARRRRSMTRNDYKEKSASTSFTVVDSDKDSNGCTGLSSNIILYFTTLIVCLCIIG